MSERQRPGCMSPMRFRLILTDYLALRQREAAELFGYSLRMIGRFERGEAPIPKNFALLLELALAKGVGVTELRKLATSINSPFDLVHR